MKKLIFLLCSWNIEFGKVFLQTLKSYNSKFCVKITFRDTIASKISRLDFFEKKSEGSNEEWQIMTDILPRFSKILLVLVFLV